MPNALSLRERRDLATRQIIVDALESHPSILAAARALQVTEPTLLYHMRRLGITVQATRSMRVAA
jgi:transcriptional regulator with GAF, ATPase, and Fis domain